MSQPDSNSSQSASGGPPPQTPTVPATITAAVTPDVLVGHTTGGSLPNIHLGTTPTPQGNSSVPSSSSSSTSPPPPPPWTNEEVMGLLINHIAGFPGTDHIIHQALRHFDLYSVNNLLFADDNALQNIHMYDQEGNDMVKDMHRTFILLLRNWLLYIQGEHGFPDNFFWQQTTLS